MQQEDGGPLAFRQKLCRLSITVLIYPGDVLLKLWIYSLVFLNVWPREGEREGRNMEENPYTWRVFGMCSIKFLKPFGSLFPDTPTDAELRPHHV